MMEVASGAIVVRAKRLTAKAFAPFGEVVQSPSRVGARTPYTQWMAQPPQGMTLRMHVNRMAPTRLPVTFITMERHPLTVQIFLPLQVQCYLVVVAPAAGGGTPVAEDAKAFLAPGNLGVVYAPGTWHTGMTVLESAGSFSVLMWRNDTAQDEEFFPLPTPMRVAR